LNSINDRPGDAPFERLELQEDRQEQKG